MIVLQSLSKPIQTALLTSTDMAAKGIRFLRRQYGAVPGDQEFSSYTAMYGATIGMEEGLTSYLVRCQEMYSQIPTSASGVSNTSKETFHTILIKGLKTRPEFAEFVQSYRTLHITDFLGLSSALMQYAQVTSLPESSITGGTT